MPAAALRMLLEELIDYAGLFPPAALPLDEVARNYGDYRRGPDAWALGHLVVPVARLDELAPLVPDGERWPVSALLGDDVAADARRVTDARRALGGRLEVDVVEGRFTSPDDLAAIAATLGPDVALFAEIPRDRVLAFGDVMRRTGARAKIRTGGVVASAFPASREVAEFIGACVRAGMPFKATAGLHHPLRGDYRLTYAPEAEQGTMHGFLNVFLAATFAGDGMDTDTMTRLLDDGDATHFTFDDGGVSWQGHRLSATQLREARGRVAIAFGSCSFREPLDDLTSLGLL